LTVTSLVQNPLARTKFIGEMPLIDRTKELWLHHSPPETDSFLSSANKRMIEIKGICDRVAALDEPVLILGESGAGKEVLARYLHSKSGRSGPFVKVNCAALPFDLLESEFFGHERGAFTGAHTGQPGRFALAAKGTILLDEVAEMNTPLQAKLLHVLQDGEYMRVGGTRTLTSQARVIAATNLHVETAVADGRFREDLFFRLNVITLEIPPLRERAEDIAALCRHFVAKYRIKYNSPITELPSDVLDAFQTYHWPGNVRQLENAVKRFLILCDPRAALSEVARPVITVAPPPRKAMSLKRLSADAAQEAERELVLRTLNEVNWNRKLAAGRLDICYKSLLNKMRRWQLTNAPSHRESGSSRDAQRLP
jgi:two-component system response regulator AtoC